MNTPEQQLSESLLAACKAAGIEKPKYVAQDKDGEVWSFDLKPSKKQTIWDGVWDGDKAQKIDHPPYADDWQDSLMEWVEPQEMLPTVFIPHEGEPLADVLARHPEHVADDSKMVEKVDASYCIQDYIDEDGGEQPSEEIKATPSDAVLRAKLEEYADSLMRPWKKAMVRSFSFWPITSARADGEVTAYAKVIDDLTRILNDEKGGIK
jgi:hypothetical protein